MSYKIIEQTENYIHIKSDTVPEWVKVLSENQKLIHEAIKTGGFSKCKHIKFVKPL